VIMQKSSVTASTPATRTSTLYLARGQSNYAALKDATSRMWSALKGVPKSVQNTVYGFTRAQSRTKRGHLMGSWPEVARACAIEGAPLIDVMAPVYEVERQLRREVYRPHVPSLLDAERAVADAGCQLVKAELQNDPIAIRQAAFLEREAAETLIHVTEMAVVYE
jgi:hypothetical protein